MVASPAKEKNKVSIITAVYNGERTIVQTIESVLSQEYRDWELIIVDDGSTDDINAKLQVYSDPRIRIYRQENAGRSVARNRGIELSEGEFLLFLDADDWLLPNGLRDHVDFLKSNPEYGVSVSDGYFCHDDGRTIISFSERRGNFLSGNVLGRIVIDPGLYSTLCAICIRRSAIELQNVRMDPKIHIGEDWDFLINLASRVLFGFTDAYTCMYRWYPTNTTRSANLAYRKEQLWMVRKKVLQSAYFGKICARTKEVFMYQVLIDILAGMPEAQEELLISSKFTDLPPKVKARLLRLVACEYLLTRDELVRVRIWLERSIILDKRNLKALLVHSAMKFHPGLASWLIRRWRRIQTLSVTWSKPDPVVW